MTVLLRSDELGLLLQAISFAAEKHRHQRRKDADASPYINHPITVANVLKQEGGIADVVVLCAALLHDTIEDTQTTQDELEREFGTAVAGVVMEVSDDKSLPKADRKRLQAEHAPALSHQAKLVKLGDKICNLRDILAHPPADWSDKRKLEYFTWVGQVAEGLRGANRPLEKVLDSLLMQSIR